MKNLLGISLVALFAVAPVMANADPVAGSPLSYAADAQPNGAALAAVVGGEPLYQLAQSAETDDNVVSAGYVKGAYNAAIKAVNKVHQEVANISSAATNALQSADITEGSANGTISVKGADVTVHGLGTAAYAAASDFDASGAAAGVQSSIEGKLDDGATGYDIDAKTLKVQGKAVLTDHQTIATGTTNGTIKVGDTDVAVSGLGDAAYAAASDFDAAGAAASALTSANAYTDSALSAYTTTSALQSTYATKAQVTANINAATAAYNIMRTWGSDDVTSATYSVSAPQSYAPGAGE